MNSYFVKSQEFSMITTGKVKTALLINVSGLGDIISSIIVAQSLKQYNVSYLIPSKFRGLFFCTQYSEYTSDCVPEQFFDLIIDLTGSRTSRQLIRFLKGKQKLGRYKNLLSRFKYSHLYHHQVPKYTSKDHIVWDYIPVLKFLNLSVGDTLYLGDISNVNYDEKCPREVVIHIDADRSIRRIPESLVISFCRYFQKNNIPVRLVGTESDIAMKICKKVDGYPIYEQGTLVELKKWLQHTLVLIAPDSGVFHLGSALGVFTLGLYGPNTYQRAGSVNPNATEYSLNYNCRPCRQDKLCPYENRCMQHLEIKPILKKLKEFLSTNGITFNLDNFE
ncbi:MAG: hypothetical protein CENE_02857 [Candidatus Celerinatantimonas neptuna]|nr:MAG: hypothetical protein CENE_02857 [Candidatus Celerinatantimonas neptuna]